MTTLITANFNSGAITDVATLMANTGHAAYSGGAIVFSDFGIVRFNTSLGSGTDKWARFRFTALPTSVAGGFYGVGLAKSGSNEGDFFSFDDAAGTQVQLYQRIRWDVDEVTIGSFFGTTFSSAQYFGVTFEYSTGIFRVWQDVSAAAPASINSWDGGAADASYTNSWPGGGSGYNYLAFACFTGTPSSNGIDDLTAGDFGAGGGGATINTILATQRRMRIG
jgi:hypothetical protein